MEQKFRTLTQIKTICGSRPVQAVEFEHWLEKNNFQNILEIQEYAEYDVYKKTQPLKYQKGSAPWDLILYFNNTLIINLADKLAYLDSLSEQLTDNGYIYCALNKWCIEIPDPDPLYKELIFDDALLPYVKNKLKNYKIMDYRYIPNDLGGMGNWVHGNNRFWLTKC